MAFHINIYYPPGRFTRQAAEVLLADVRHQLKGVYPDASIDVRENDRPRFEIGLDLGMGENRGSCRDEAEDARRAVDLAIEGLGL